MIEGAVSDDILRCLLTIGILHLICFQIWLVNKWLELEANCKTIGLWIISIINSADILAAIWALFDLSIIKAI